MEAIGQIVVRIADSNATWFGLGWLRPEKHEHVSYRYILFSSILLGFPGVGLGGGLIFLFLGLVHGEILITQLLGAELSHDNDFASRNAHSWPVAVLNRRLFLAEYRLQALGARGSR